MNVFHPKKVPGKILLFGEYTALSGKPALSIPYFAVSGFLDFLPRHPAPEQIQSNETLNKFYLYLDQSGKKKLIHFELNLQNFKNDIEKGLFFNSTIPLNYGLGSSGALVASVFEKYSPGEQKDFSLNELKIILAEMESFFHGKSSGIDPLCSFLQKPLIIRNNEIELVTNVKNLNGNFFLYDTGVKRSTKGFVKIFNHKYSQNSFAEMIENSLNPSNMEAIKAYVRADPNSLFKQFEIISSIQYTYFREMIPETVLNFWLNGLNSKKYFLKLCGAGGGGYLLGFTLSPESEFEGFSPVFLEDQKEHIN